MRLRATCVCDFGGNSPHRCTVIALPRLPSETRVQPLKHVADSPCYTTQGGREERRGGEGGDASTAGLSHQSDCVASVRAASAWRERGSLVRSCGCVRLKEERRVGSDISTNPPSVTASPLQLRSRLRRRGAERTAEG